jgi:enamine deaminase RidA (YjgF/YER057c/UK114 family)
MPPREAVFPKERHALYEQHGYSAAIRSGDLLFVSGQVGSLPDGSPEPDFEAQVRLAFAIGVNWLAGFDFEIKVIARLPQSA